MTSATSKVVQIIAVILQVLNAVNVSQLPPKWQAAVTGVITVFQSIMGVLAHYYTPAGNAISGVTGNVTTTQGEILTKVPTTKQ